MDFQNIRVIGSAGWFFNRNEPFSKGVFVTYLCVFFSFLSAKSNYKTIKNIHWLLQNIVIFD